MKRVILVCGVGVVLLGPRLAEAAEMRNALISAHTKDLVVLQGEKLVPFQSDEFLKAPYTLLYYGAGWCPDCRRFSPSLVEAYNQQPKGEKRFEVLLFSMDKTADGLLKFMRTEKMNWPALAFNKIGRAEDLKKYYSGHGIPCLSVIDSEGKVLLQSKSDEDAEEILKELKDLLKQPPAKEH